MNRDLKKNILVISDLHLGEGIGPAAPTTSYLRRLATLDRELCAFFQHYTAHRLGERSWRLIINGDMVDFMSVLIIPDGSHATTTADEQQYGLGHGEAHSVAKLECVMERHRAVFVELARFVAAGNELVLVGGNHDVEFHYPAVQRTLVDALVALGAPAALIRFHPWFYYEAEVVYVEHGHQYDEYCSFDYQLHPVEPTRGVTLSVAHAGVRYFTNLVPQIDPHNCEGWGFLDYMRWARAQGARGVAKLVLLYAALIKHLIGIWSLLTDRASDAARAEHHRRRLQELAVEYQIAAARLEALDGLRRLPVLKSFYKLLVALFLDRFLLGVATLAALVVMLCLMSGWWKPIAAVGVIAVAAATNHLLSRTRNLDSSTLLRRAPQAIWRIFRAPFIVFGHTHHPEAVRLEGGATYYNTGSFAPQAGHPAFTHLIIAGDDQPKATLCSWRDGASSPLATASNALS